MLLRNVWMMTIINLILPSVRVHLHIILSKQFLHTDFSHLHDWFTHLKITQNEKNSPLKHFAWTHWMKPGLTGVRGNISVDFSEAKILVW